MKAIKELYINKKINTVTAAQLLTKHNGNPLPGNLQIIVKNWK